MSLLKTTSYPDVPMLNPDCVYCGVCVDECPVGAIYVTQDVPDDEAGAFFLDEEACHEEAPDCDYPCIECCPVDALYLPKKKDEGSN